LQVLVDGKVVGLIKSGETRDFPVPPGRRRVQVRQDFLRSDELAVSADDGGVCVLECGSYVEGWTFFIILFWLWRTLVPGKLFYVRRKTGAR
jgi:hypothetical protein